MMLSQQLLDELNTAVSRRKLDSVADVIRRNASECYAMVAVGEDDYSAIGNTRFGGEPDLPETFEWPCDTTRGTLRYCNFVAQINFSELPALSGPRILPSRGVLYLFVRQLESAGEPVLIEGLFVDDEAASLARRPSPPPDALCDEYCVNLVPQKVAAIPSVSIATFRKDYRRQIDSRAEEIDGEDGEFRRIHLELDLRRDGQIGQLLGFANAGDERDNLYRHVALSQLGERRRMDTDYWDSFEEYEAEIERWKDNAQLVKGYQGMRDGVTWLMSNREIISSEADAWRLLLQIDSNIEMNLLINDADPLYVFVREADLARKIFSHLAGEVTQG